jgi:membrane fusion protein (multidrug efflux system)
MLLGRMTKQRLISGPVLFSAAHKRTPKQPAPPKGNPLKEHRKFLLIGVPIIFLIICLIVYLTGGRYVSTEDAYVMGARTEISANVVGRVIEIAVTDNQEVTKNDILYKLDDRDYINARNDALAKLANAKLQITSLKATYKQRQADMRSAQAKLNYLDREFKRQTALAESGISSQTQLDEARQALISARQNFDAIDQNAASILASLNEDPEIDVNNHPTVQQAQAMLDQAELNLSHTVVKAPLDGILSKVENLQIGDYIPAAKPVFGLVSNKDIWIEGNFKETELTHMRPGQKATIKIDTYPGRVFHGSVISISPCTGSVLSILPPENATGNWVKVVQRLPVRISIDDPDPEQPLRMGLSVTVKVDTGHSRIGLGMHNDK